MSGKPVAWHRLLACVASAVAQLLIIVGAMWLALRMPAGSCPACGIRQAVKAIYVMGGAVLGLAIAAMTGSWLASRRGRRGLANAIFDGWGLSLVLLAALIVCLLLWPSGD